MNKVFSSVIIAIFLFISSNIQGKHIIGGVVYYTYIESPSPGINRYLLEMKQYRDCVPEAQKANFDGLFGELSALSTVYSVKGNISTLIKVLDFGEPKVSKVSANSPNPCLSVPPNLCVEEGVYSVIIDLPIINNSYYIVYQRCCRNNTISNLVTPSELGATYYVEITKEAQLNKNSTPQFNNFPPLAICANDNLDFDHSSTDKDGDEVRYDFFTPLIGGGSNGENCESLAPNPDCPPPFEQVKYRSPFSYDNPIFGMPRFSIDPISGVLKGVPVNTGQYVVGILIREFRNGVLLSEIRREFQFNVVQCEKVVDALIEIKGIKRKDLDIKLCGDKLVDINVESSNDYKISWTNVDPNSQITFSNSKSLRIDPLIFGLYSGTVVINEGLQCSDSAKYKILVLPGLTADFNYDYDTCVGKTIDLSNISMTELGDSFLSNWIHNENIFSQNQDAVFDKLEVGFLPISLAIIDQNQCKDTITKVIPFFPIPENEITQPNSLEGCEPFLVKFEKLAPYLTNEYDIIWDFGDGGTQTGLTPTHIYEENGIYDVRVKIVNYFGCEANQFFPSNITVLEVPVANFIFEPKNLSNFQKSTQIVDLSQNAVIYDYSIRQNFISNESEPIIAFQDTGLYELTQIVSHANGCLDTFKTIIDVEPKYKLFIPTAFTPNFDGQNDAFNIIGIPFGVTNFRLLISDRYGQIVFETNELTDTWDGKIKNGNLLIEDIYVVKVEYNEPRGQKKTIFSTLMLFQ